MLHMQCYKFAKLQHLTVAEYYTSPFSVDFISMLSCFKAVLIISYLSTAEYILHMQCCKVALMKYLTTAETSSD